MFNSLAVSISSWTVFLVAGLSKQAEAIHIESNILGDGVQHTERGLRFLILKTRLILKSRSWRAHAWPC